ncbi:MAG TPA: nitrogenase component 1 [Myxococcota bacterium]|nr:nitrogenase component 1 [Myxococcota bacterium]HQK51517.1 nitrogenase component 1 [Myxococcota bacterium]
MRDPIEPFELRDVDSGDLFGVFLAVHAIPGAVMLLHTTVGCKFKTQLQLVSHDWFQESHNQRLWTGVDDIRLIQGSGERLLQFATTWYERRRPEVFVVSTNAAVDLSAFDVEQAVRELRNRLPCHVLLVRAPGTIGSVARGYGRVLAALAETLPIDGNGDPEEAALVGYVFDRYEMEHPANFAELRRLLRAIGLRMGATWLSGEGMGVLQGIARAGTWLVLPEGRFARAALDRRAGGRKVADVSLPLGFAGTMAFLREAGQAAGVPPERVEACIERELQRAAPLAAQGARRLADRRAGVFLPTRLAAAVAVWLAELGIQVPLVGLTDGEDADPEAFQAVLDRLEAPGTLRPELLVAPSRDGGIRALEREMSRGGPVHLVVGTSPWAGPLRHKIPVVELGYPSTRQHWIYPVPFLGFNGAVALVQRFVDACSLHG